VKYALVLGGGGPVGISWETGLLAGIHNAGLNLSKADLIVGTSAGSIVGAQIATGCDLDQLYLQQLEPAPDLMAQPVPDLTPLMQALMESAAASETLQQMRKRMGVGATRTLTGSETDWLNAIASRLPVHTWPEHLKVTAVDTADGSFTVWEKTSGVPLPVAVASSCAVPFVFSPVTINGRRYMDGGIGSPTNATIAAGYDLVLILNPLSRIMGSTAVFNAEKTQLESGGSRVEVLEPDDNASAAIGFNMMDYTRCAAAAKAGRLQGTQVAETLRVAFTK
jgi:NTE family protein